MSWLLLLADIYPNSPINGILWALGCGGIGVLATLVARGLWSKYGAREVETSVEAWFGKPEQVAALEEKIRRVIENHIRRDDGLISKELQALAGHFRHETDADQRFRQATKLDLARLKSALNLLTRGSFHSESAPDVEEAQVLEPEADSSGSWKAKP